VLNAILLFVGLQTTAPGFPTGEIVAEVQCAADSAETYALYLPKSYSPGRAWPVILAFDPGGRGRTPIERYQAAAEQYGFIVAASNNSRNRTNNDKAVVTMANDVLSRFKVDTRRVYMAGMSGGARVALGAALASTGIAGVIASSAGFPDGTPRKSVPFPIFATAGTEDFNHLEMRRLDTMLTSPHRLVIFTGGHTWLSSELAIEAVEWMQVQAMKGGVVSRDSETIKRLLAKRLTAAEAAKTDKDMFLALKGIVDDFTDLADVTMARDRVAELAADPGVRDALKRDLDEDNHETDVLLGIKALEAKLANDAERTRALNELRRQWKELSEQANKPDDSSDRRLARRVLGLLGSTVTTKDADYLKIISEYRPARGGRGQ